MSPRLIWLLKNVNTWVWSVSSTRGPPVQRPRPEPPSITQPKHAGNSLRDDEFSLMWVSSWRLDALRNKLQDKRCQFETGMEKGLTDGLSNVTDQLYNHKCIFIQCQSHATTNFLFYRRLVSTLIPIHHQALSKNKNTETLLRWRSPLYIKNIYKCVKIYTGCLVVHYKNSVKKYEQTLCRCKIEW